MVIQKEKTQKEQQATASQIRCPDCGKMIPLDVKLAASCGHAIVKSDKGTYVFCPETRIKQE